MKKSREKTFIIFAKCIKMVSGSIDSTPWARGRADDVVPADKLLGRIDEWLDHEPASSKRMGLSHGLSVGANAAAALSGTSF